MPDCLVLRNSSGNSAKLRDHRQKSTRKTVLFPFGYKTQTGVACLTQSHEHRLVNRSTTSASRCLDSVNKRIVRYVANLPVQNIGNKSASDFFQGDCNTALLQWIRRNPWLATFQELFISQTGHNDHSVDGSKLTEIGIQASSR